MERFLQSILISFYRGSNAIFDLSDSSLAYTISATSYPAFKFDLFKDVKFNNKYETSGVNASFDVENWNNWCYW